MVIFLREKKWKEEIEHFIEHHILVLIWAVGAIMKTKGPEKIVKLMELKFSSMYLHVMLISVTYLTSLSFVENICL